MREKNILIEGFILLEDNNKHFTTDNMSAQEKKAEAMILEAQKKMNPSGVFSMFSSPKFDEAAELLSKAANCYKIAKKCKQKALFSIYIMYTKGLILL